MSDTKVAITIDEEKLLEKVARLARECAKLDPRFEQRLAEEGAREDFAAWPES